MIPDTHPADNLLRPFDGNVPGISVLLLVDGNAVYARLAGNGGPGAQRSSHHCHKLSPGIVDEAVHCGGYPAAGSAWRTHARYADSLLF
jgi:hypothetical protein